MKALRNIYPALLALAFCFILTGCGDDDDDDDDDNQGPQQFAPVTSAALQDPNAVYTVNIAGQGAFTLRFPAAGQYQIIANGQTVNGTISNLQRNGNTWTATLTPDQNQQGGQTGAATLTWTGTNAGTFVFQPQGAAAQSGTFTVTQSVPNPNPGNTNTNNPNPGNTNGTTGLVGKTLQLTYPGGGGEKFVFTSDTTASYENGTDTATFTYDTTTGQLNFTRGGGQTYSLIIPAGSNTGTTTVTYRESPNVQPDIGPASFTLQ
jgi:hypothetical protein